MDGEPVKHFIFTNNTKDQLKIETGSMEEEAGIR
jgi:hypothetical protein